MQYVSPLGAPENCLGSICLGLDAAADLHRINGKCHIRPGAASQPPLLALVQAAKGRVDIYTITNVSDNLAAVQVPSCTGRLLPFP
jgi:hypothetical protein